MFEYWKSPDYLRLSDNSDEWKKREWSPAK
jgi:hypothetical protein